MIIVIDGYNFIKNIFSHTKNNAEEQRELFIKQLSFYKHRKKSSVKEVVVVFDAGPLGHATREVHQGVVVVFSGQDSCADDWIVEYVERNKGKEILLVSCDRGLISRCEKTWVDTILVDEFHNFLQNVLVECRKESENVINTIDSSLTKFKRDDVDTINFNIDGDDALLDVLMEEASINIGAYDNKDDDYEEKNSKKGKKYTLPKKEKRIYKKLKKL
jgi:predicted RNA-binding protein with PIN domain